ncbi:TPA: hypothetical protein ACK3JH_000975 [Mannheimia haemolytica]
MKLVKFSAIVLATLFTVGCSGFEALEQEFAAAESVNRYAHAKRTTPQQKTVNPSVYRQTADRTAQAAKTTVAKRINTTACTDLDDWYLDGYRVGKSFRIQKNQMLEQRSRYCGYNAKQLPSQYRSNWDRGFLMGSKS